MARLSKKEINTKLRLLKEMSDAHSSGYGSEHAAKARIRTMRILLQQLKENLPPEDYKKVEGHLRKSDRQKKIKTRDQEVEKAPQRKI